MSKTAERYKRYYQLGFYTKKALWNLVLKGKITEEEYHQIIEEIDNENNSGNTDISE